MKLSEAIRKGHTMIRETRSVFVGDGCGCAIGAAWYGLGRNFDDRFTDSGIIHAEGIMRWVSEQTGIPYSVMQTISARHCGGMTRLELADWVERKYESKLPQKARETDEEYASRMVREITNVKQEPLTADAR